jgi:hypothetical protein
MHLVEQMVSGAPIIMGVVAGVFATAVLHVIRRIRRLIRTAALFAVAGGLGAGGGAPILHTLLTTWRGGRQR